MNESITLVTVFQNQEKQLDSAMSYWQKSLKFMNLNFSVIAIDNGSTDQTGARLEALKEKYSNLKVFHQERGSHGSALTHAYYHAISLPNTWTLQVDTNRTVAPSELNKIWSERDSSTLILGRRKAHSNSLFSKALKFIVAKQFNAHLHDPNTPLRLIKTDYLSPLLVVLPLNNFYPNTLMSLLAYNGQMDVQEVPIKEKVGKLSTLDRVKSTARLVRDLIKFRIHFKERVATVMELKTKSEDNQFPSHSKSA